MVGDKLSIADLYLWVVLAWCVAGQESPSARCWRQRRSLNPRGGADAPEESPQPLPFYAALPG